MDDPKQPLSPVTESDEEWGWPGLRPFTAKEIEKHKKPWWPIHQLAKEWECQEFEIDHLASDKKLELVYRSDPREGMEDILYQAVTASGRDRFEAKDATLTDEQRALWSAHKCWELEEAVMLLNGVNPESKRAVIYKAAFRGYAEHLSWYQQQVLRDHGGPLLQTWRKIRLAIDGGVLEVTDNRICLSGLVKCASEIGIEIPDWLADVEPDAPTAKVKRKAPDNFVAALIQLLAEIGNRAGKKKMNFNTREMLGQKEDLWKVACKFDIALDITPSTFDTYIKGLIAFKHGSPKEERSFYKDLFPEYSKQPAEPASQNTVNK